MRLCLEFVQMNKTVVWAAKFKFPSFLAKAYTVAFFQKQTPWTAVLLSFSGDVPCHGSMFCVRLRPILFYFLRYFWQLLLNILDADYVVNPTNIAWPTPFIFRAEFQRTVRWRFFFLKFLSVCHEKRGAYMRFWVCVFLNESLQYFFFFLILLAGLSRLIWYVSVSVHRNFYKEPHMHFVKS